MEVSHILFGHTTGSIPRPLRLQEDSREPPSQEKENGTHLLGFTVVGSMSSPPDKMLSGPPVPAACTLLTAPASSPTVVTASVEEAKFVRICRCLTRLEDEDVRRERGCKEVRAGRTWGFKKEKEVLAPTRGEVERPMR